MDGNFKPHDSNIMKLSLDDSGYSVFIVQNLKEQGFKFEIAHYH